MGSITSFGKQALKILICFCLVYTPFFANAGAAEKWDLVENHYDDIGKNMSYTAKKVGSAINDASYKAKVPVSAATLGSSVAMLVRGGLAGAAVIGLIEGVGWIIENGVVKKQDGEEQNAPTAEYIWTLGSSFSLRENPDKLSCSSDFSSEFLSTVINRFVYCANHTFKENTARCTGYDGLDRYACQAGHPNGGTLDHFRLQRIKNKDYDPTFKPRYVPVSDTELGNKIIESPAAPQIIPDVYNPNQPTNTPARDASNDALDKALPDTDPATGESKPKPNTDTDGDGKPDTYDPTAPDAGSEFKFPPFCEIAPVMCVWYEKYSEDSKKTDVHRGEQKSFWEKVQDWFDWTKENPDTPEDNAIPQITELDIGQLDTGTFKATPGCPQPVQVPVGLGGSGSISISYEPICSFASKWSFVAPLIGFLSGAMIIVGVGRKGEDGEL